MDKQKMTKIRQRCSLCKQINHNKRKCHIINSIKVDWINIKNITNWNKELILAIMNVSGNLFKYIPDSFKSDIDIQINAVTNEPNAIRMTDTCALPEDTIKLLCSKNGNLLRYLDYEQQNNYKIAEIAIKNTGMAWFYISSALKSNEELLKFAIENNPNVAQIISQNKEQFKQAQALLKNHKLTTHFPNIGECGICYNTNNLVNLKCHETHNVCITCVEHIHEHCPYCRKKFNKPKINNDTKIWS